MINLHNQNKEAGFALLITLIVVGVVLSVGVGLLDLSTKQLRLSTNAKESELAFHAANAGSECARYVLRNNAVDMENGNEISPSCFGLTIDDLDPVDGSGSEPEPDLDLDNASDGESHLYTYSFTWGEDELRCTQIATLVASSSVSGGGATTTNMTDLIPGYPADSELYCGPGSRCSVLSIRGYNKDCSNIGNYGTVEREVLLQF